MKSRKSDITSDALLQNLEALTRDLNVKVVDQSAATIDELVQKTGLSPWHVRRMAAANVKADRWEKVYKRVPTARCLLYAFRVKKRS